MMTNGRGTPALIPGILVPMNGHAGAMVPGNANYLMDSQRYDHRLTGPYPPPPPMMCDKPVMCGKYDHFDDGFMYNREFDDRRRRRKHQGSRYHEYRYSNRPDTACMVM
jgi:hypothetical protein